MAKKTAKTSKKTTKVQKTKTARSSSPAKKQPKNKKIAVKSKSAYITAEITPHKKSKKIEGRSPIGKKLQEIRRHLLKQKESLLAEAEEALNALPGQTAFPDMGDQATAEIDRNFMLRLRSREQKLLKKIDEAIERIDSGTFGMCEGCGMEIDFRRLEARPVTTLCIECKVQQEEEEKLRES